MKRVLVYRYEENLKPTGGPNGYLYSLKLGIDQIKNEEISIEFLLSNKNQSNFKENAKYSDNKIIKYLLNVYRRIKHIKFNLSIIIGKKKIPIDINQYDAIHFHATCDLYFVRKDLSSYKGKVILTSHSPQPLAYEFIESSSPLELKILGKIYKKMLASDKYSFMRSDFIIFPCKYADEPYSRLWPEYEKIKKAKKDSFRYLLTGSIPAKVKRNRIEIRKKYGIPEDAFVISFVGRHNEIKGYDRFIKICELVLKKEKNVYILVAGTIGPLNPPSINRWIEIGWTNDPHSIIAASDTFVLPNKETYFDLVFLEVLSLGIPIIASYTGGNKYFSQYNYKGIKLFQSNDKCIEMLLDNMRFSQDEIKSIKNQNISLYESNFTINTFAKNYFGILQTILTGE